MRLLIEIKNSDGTLTLSQASKKTKISEGYLKQLASVLEKNNIIKGKKGPKGGYLIANPDVSLKELVDIFSGGVQLAPCIDENYRCSIVDTCPATDMWHNLNDNINKLFYDIKLKGF